MSKKPILTKNSAILSIIVCILILIPNTYADQNDSLKLIPADSMFIARIKNLDRTLGQLDQFLTGIAPMPMATSMAVRMQLAAALGNPELKGLNTAGDVIIFAPLPGTDLSNPENFNFALLLPVTDFNLFVSENPNISQPNPQGISTLQSQNMPPLTITKAANYAMVSMPGVENLLINAAKAISSNSFTSISATLDQHQKNLAENSPIWFHGNIEMINKTFGPMLKQELKQAFSMLSQLQQNQTQSFDPTKIMSLYSEIAAKFLEQTNSIELAIEPKADVLYLKNNIKAVKGSDMDKMLVAEPAKNNNPLLGYLENDAIINGSFRINTKFMKNINAEMYDLIDTLSPSTDPQQVQNRNRIFDDMYNSTGDFAVFSMKKAPSKTPPFDIQYALQLKDRQKFFDTMYKSFDIFKDSGLIQFYDQLGLIIDFDVKKAVQKYNNVSIDSALFSIQPKDTNSPEGQMIKALYGPGLEYRWAAVNNTFVVAVCGDYQQNIKKLIDQANAPSPRNTPQDLINALNFLPNADKADIFFTYNYLRILQMLPEMTKNLPMPTPPMPNIDVPTSSSFAIAANVNNGSVNTDIAMPKQHITEIVNYFMIMQQQMMQQYQQQMDQDTNTP